MCNKKDYSQQVEVTSERTLLKASARDSPLYLSPFSAAEGGVGVGVGVRGGRGGRLGMVADSAGWRFPVCRTPSSGRDTACKTTTATPTPSHKVHTRCTHHHTYVDRHKKNKSQLLLLQAALQALIFSPLNFNMFWCRFILTTTFVTKCAILQNNSENRTVEQATHLHS